MTPDNNDVFEGQGMTFMSANQASTAPSATPPPITAPKVDLANAPANQTIPPVDASALQPGVPLKNAGGNPAPPDPTQIAANLAGSGNGVSAAAGAAPPLPQADDKDDIFQQLGVKAPTPVVQNNDAFTTGVNIQQPQTPEQQQAAQYALEQQKQYADLAASRFTPEQQAAFKNNPIGMLEAIKNIADYPDVPALLSKQQSGQQLSQIEQNRLNDYIDHNVEVGQRGMSWNGQTAFVAPQLPQTAVEFAKGGNDQNINPPAVPIAGNEPSAPQPASVLPAPYTPKYGETAINAFSAATDKGKSLIAQGETAPATTALKMLGYMTPDYAAKATSLETPMVTQASNLPAPLRESLYTAFLQQDPSAQMSKVMTPSGWSQMLDSLGESKVAQIVHGFVTKAGNVGSAAWQGTKEGFDTSQPAGLSPENYHALGLDEPTTGVGSFIKQLPKSLLGGGAALADMLFQKFPSAIINGGIEGIVQATREAGASETTAAQLTGDLNDLVASEMGRATGHVAEASPKNLTLDHYMQALAPTQDAALVDGGVVSVSGGKSTASAAVENILQSKGVEVGHAAETVDNMTAAEKDNFLHANMELPNSAYPEMGETEAPKEPVKSIPDVANQNAAPELKAAQVLKDEAPDVYQPKTVHLDTAEPPAPEEAILKGQTASQQASSPPPIADNQSGFNAAWRKMQSVGADIKTNYLKPIYAELFNDIQPIEDLAKIARAKGAEIPAGERSDLLTSFVRSTPEWIKRNQTVATTVWDADGNQRITGKAVKSVYDDFDNTFQKTEPSMAKRHADFDSFLIAERFNEEAANASKTGAKVTDEQKMNSAKVIADLGQKYGDDFRLFGTYADEARAWDNRIAHNLVSSGLKTQEWYDAMTSARSKYSPLQRVVEEETGQRGISERNGLGTDNNPNQIGALKQFKGSELEVKNTLNSRIKNSALILQKSASNQLRRSIAKYADYYPDQVKVSNPRIIKAEVKMDYDPKLRSKLEAAVEHFGGKTERAEKVGEGPGMKGARGSYDAMQNLVKVRVGSTDGTLAHEVGHLLDEKLGIGKKLLADPEIKVELQKLAEDRLGSTTELENDEHGNPEFQTEIKKNGAKYAAYIKEDAEVIANMFDAYVRSPEQFAETAPKAFEAFSKMLKEDPKLSFIEDIKPSTERASEVVQKVQRDMVGPKNSVPFYEDGKRKYLELSPEVFKAFNNMTPMQMGMVEKFIGGIFRKSTSLLKHGATSYPAFLIRHAYRAVETSFLNTPGKNPLTFLKHASVDIPKAMFDVMGKSEEYSRWKSSSGGFNKFMDLTDEGLSKMQKEMFSKGNVADMINPLHWLHVMQNISDQGPRVAVFEKLKAGGMSDLEAGLASLEATGNYGRHGSFIKRVNQYAPFLNDMMQGGDRFIRSVAKDPAAFTIKAIATITMPQLVMTGYYLYAADQKTRDEYLNIPDWRKAAYMNIKIGNTWIPFPRAFAPGFVYGGLPEKIMIHMFNGYHPEGKNFWLNLMAQTATSVSPVFDWTRAMPPIIKAQMENITNYSFFKGRPLFAGDMNKTAPEMQYNQYTSETAKVLGKLFGYSPTDIDNTIYDMSAKIGQYSLQLSDAGINAYRKAEGVPVSQHNQRAVDNPIYGGLSEETPTGTNTESFTEFKEHLGDTTKAYNEAKELKGSDAAQYRQDNHQLISQYPRVEAADKQIYDTLKQIKQVYNNPGIPPDQKDTIIQAKSDAINRIAESVNKSFRASSGGKQ